MKVESIEFVRSAARTDDLPREPLPQVAMVGRSNVGKSSLINALAGRQVARTSAAAGKTRLINLYRVRLRGTAPSTLYLVDLPGYGYARGGAGAAGTFEALTRDYFRCPPGHEAARGEPVGPAAAILIIDARHPALEADRNARDWLRTTGLPWIPVASKIDKLTRAERTRANQAWTRLYDVPVLPVSAVTGEGLHDLWKQLTTLLDRNKPAPIPR